MQKQARTRSNIPGRLRRGAIHRLLAGSVVLTLVAASAGLSDDDQPAAGLNGILPRDVPEGLTDDDWEALEESELSAWSTEMHAAVEALYESSRTDDVEAQRAAIADLRTRLSDLDTARRDSRNADVAQALSSLYNKLLRRVDLAEAVLNTIEVDVEAARSARTADAFQALGDAVASLESDLRRVPRGSAWLPYVNAGELKRAAAGRDLSPEAMEAISSAHNKIVSRDTLEDDAQREFLGRDSFQNLADALSRVLDAANWEPTAENNAAVREQAAALIAAVEAYEVEGSDAQARAARNAYNKLREVAADGGALVSDVMRTHYFGFNLRIAINEELMRRFANDSRQEAGTINEPVQEAWVCGNTCTATNVTVDFKPNDDRAQFNVLVNGTVRANTTANTSQATVYGGSTGNFSATKPVYFDGKNFNLGRINVYANANTYTYDVQTKFFFLLRPITDAIAEREVAKRRPQTTALTRQRMESTVREEVDTEVSNQFGNASMKLESELYGPLRELGWHPDALKTSSTEQSMTIRARLLEPDELAAQIPANMPSPPRGGLVLQLHESLLNNGVDGLDIAGKTLTDEELKAVIEDRISTLTGKDFEFSKPEDDQTAAQDEDAEAGDEEDDETASYVFSESDPIRFQIEGGIINVTLKTGLKREGKDDIPEHVITVPLGLSVEGEQIVMARNGSVRVVPSEGVRRNIVRQRIMLGKVQRSIPDRTFRNDLKLEQQGKQVILNVHSIEANDGWVTVLAD